jgi:hypothetical protein
MPSTDPKPELTAKASMAQPVSQPAVYASGLISSPPAPHEKCLRPRREFLLLVGQLQIKLALRSITPLLP